MADARHEETQEEENHEVLRILVVALLGLIIGTFVRFTETQLLPIVRDAFRCASLALPPYSLSVFLAGVITSGLRDALSERLHETGATNEIFSEAIADAQLVEPSVILLVLLPPLIYMSAVHMSWVVFRRVSGQALLLAFPGVILQAYIVAAFFRYAMNYGSVEEGGLWNWDVSLTFASIVCATDPVAVVGALHELGAPKKLANVIDGEALLNDGSAFVMFLIFRENVDALHRGDPLHTGATGVAFFAQLALGGFALGCLSFTIMNTWLAVVENDWRVELSIILAGVYATFAVAEGLLHVSGVLAVVTLGLLMTRRGKYSMSPEASVAAEWIMPMVAYVTETLIFFIAGIAAWTALTSYSEIVYTDALVLYCVLHLARGLTILVLYPILSHTGYDMRPGELLVVVYAGLRGAVSQTLSLILIADVAFKPIDRARIHFLVASATVLTLVINGTTVKPLYQALKLYPANKYRGLIVQRAIAILEGEAMQKIKEKLIDQDCLYSRANWETVKALIPSLEGTTLGDNNQLQIGEGSRIEVFSDALIRRILSIEQTSRARLEADVAKMALEVPEDESAKGIGAKMHSSFTQGGWFAPTSKRVEQAIAKKNTQVDPRVECRTHTFLAIALADKEHEPTKVDKPAVPKMSKFASRTAHNKAHDRFTGAASRVVNAGVAATAFDTGDTYTQVEKRGGIVSSLFEVVRQLYDEQYESEMLSGGPLAICREGLQAAEDFLAEFPRASTGSAFELELGVIEYMLPSRPAWAGAAEKIPLVGPVLAQHAEFFSCFDRTEALAGFVRAHERLADIVASDPSRSRFVKHAVSPALAKARASLHAHHLERWVVVSFQISILAARAANDAKRDEVKKLGHAGTLSHQDVGQLAPVFDHAHYKLEASRSGAFFGAMRFARAVERARTSSDMGN